MKSTRLLSAAFAAVAMLGACGGGGSESTAPPPAAAPLAITVDNQALVARAAMDGSTALAGAQVLASDDRTTALSAGATAGVTARGAVLGAAQRALALIVPQQRRTVLSARSRPLDILPPVTDACGEGGSFTLTVDDRDDDEDISSGDTMTLAFAQCSELADERIHGTIVFTFSSVTSETQFSGTLAFQSVTMTLGHSVTRISGSVSIGYQETSQIHMELSVGAAGLTASITTSVYEDSVVYRPGLRIDLIETSTASLFSLDGSLSTSALGGLITVATLQPLAQLNGDAFPNSGLMRIDGAGASRLLVTVLSNTQVQLELDADGNGIFTPPIVLPWIDLLSD
ncbi:hypothetical protein [Piscinibacter sp.]|uniref:hypothetical protein n=1 Tax=Piscinibacter sp. TaxID=1903157 RepID=UPI002C477C9E|nr:hypothetical protein [Albitalea sp.]HUG21326.1 hypothetical protein [Albitalea sp.]